jgi:hypothetical protein
VTALWSASRTDQIACLSDLCSKDQVAQGNYVAQVRGGRWEGSEAWNGFTAALRHVTVTERVLEIKCLCPSG